MHMSEERSETNLEAGLRKKTQVQWGRTLSSDRIPYKQEDSSPQPRMITFKYKSQNKPEIPPQDVHGLHMKLAQLRGEHAKLKSFPYIDKDSCISVEGSSSERNISKETIKSSSNKSFDNFKKVNDRNKEITGLIALNQHLQQKLNDVSLENAELKRFHYEFQQKMKEYELMVRQINIKEEEKIAYKQIQKQNQQLYQQKNSLVSLNERLQGSIKQLQDKYRIKEESLARQKEERKKAEQKYFVLKQKFNLGELQKRKIQMEKQFLEKDKNYEIEKLRTNSDKPVLQIKTSECSEVLNLKQELKLKDERYKLLLAEFKECKGQDKEKLSLHQALEKAQTTIAELRRNELQNIQKYKQVSCELEKLRTSVSKVPEQQYSSENQIANLRQFIQMENVEKQKFIDEFNQMNEQLKELRTQNLTLQHENDQYRLHCEDLKRQLDFVKEKLHKRMKESERNSDFEYSTLMSRVKVLEKMESEFNMIKSHRFQEEQQKISRQYSHQEEVSKLMRKIGQAQLQVEKVREMDKIEIHLWERKLEGEKELWNRKQAQYLKQLSELRAQIHFEKVEAEKKIKNKSQNLQKAVNQLTTSKNIKQNEVDGVRNFYETELRKQNEKHYYQLSQMLYKIDTLTKSNEQCLKENSKYAHAESQLQELKKIHRTTQNAVTSTLHLWDIKETQYENIKQVMAQFH